MNADRGQFIGVIAKTTFLIVGVLGWAIQASALEVVELRQISVASDGTEANDLSKHSAISPDGQYVTFSSKNSISRAVNS